MFSFKKLRDSVYELKFDDQCELCLTFLRYQEFYESPKFHNVKFTWAEFISWYCKEQNKSGVFSYMRDWGGFNLPVSIIKEVHDLGISDPNNYDALMLELYSSMPHNAYLIGCTSNCKIDVHEMTHAMYHIDRDYHVKCNDEIQKYENIDELKQPLLSSGYAEVTVIDEIQAYITTGDHNFYKKIKNTKRYKHLEKALKDIHKKHYSEFVKGCK